MGHGGTLGDDLDDCREGLPPTTASLPDSAPRLLWPHPGSLAGRPGQLRLERVPGTPSAGTCILSGENVACEHLLSNKVVGKSR